MNHTEPSDGEQNYIVGNKVGLTAQFIHHACEPVARTLSVTPLKRVLFPNAETATPLLFDGPDITLFGDVPKAEPESRKAPRRPVIAVRKVKTFWTFDLEYEIVEDGACDLNGSLEGPIGECQLQTCVLFEYKLS